MLVQCIGACLQVILPAFPAVHVADDYFTLGIVHPFVDWKDSGDGNETIPTAVSVGYGRPMRAKNLYWEADGLLTVARGELQGFFSTDKYSVNSLGIYGVWRGSGTTFFTARGGFAYTSVSGIGEDGANGSSFSPAFGAGVGFGRRFGIELRRLNSDVNSLQFSYRFD